MKKLSGVVVSQRRVAKCLADRLLGHFGDKIEAIVLYGSVARGEAERESDIDLLIIVPEGEIRKQVLSLSYYVDLEFGTVTSHVHMNSKEFERYVNLGDPFLKDVLKEGIILYDRGFYSRVRESLFKQG